MKILNDSSPKNLLLTLLVALLFLGAAGPAYAQDPTPEISDDQVNEIAKQMYCPVCENVPLDVCPTQACHQWRELIRQKLGEGWSEVQIKAYFAEQYGDRVLAEPPARGLNWMFYVLPPLVFVLGAVFTVRLMRSWKTAPRAAEENLPTIEDDYVNRLEEELKNRS
jgi:cytochrome c-type biogenesis protein CcmH